MTTDIKELKKSIKKYLTKGYNIQDIKEAYIDAGFPKKLVEQALEAKKPKEKAKKTSLLGIWKPQKPAVLKKKTTKTKVAEPTKKPKIKKPIKSEGTPVKKQRKKSVFRSRNSIAVILLILFFTAIGIVIWLFPVTCATESCFIKHANNCDAATFRNRIDGTIMSYQTNNCFIIKTVEELSPDEPPEIRKRFKGKSMTCSYNKGDFDPLYINTISAHLNTCQGELREEIIRLVA